jgi:methanogenic corrinoid protein MtbC1
MTEFEDESYPLTELAKNYIEALLNVQRDSASNMILNAVEEGTDIKDIYIHVFESSQHEIGRLWQTNQITVAQEHFCTAATQLIMSQLYPHILRTNKNGLRMVAACAAGEMHEMGVRMVADFFAMDGWDTYYLGANNPSASILETLKKLKPDILVLSASIPSNVDVLADLIASIRKSPDISTIKILVGGRPFMLSPELYKKVGAEGCPLSARESVSLANELLS